MIFVISSRVSSVDPHLVALQRLAPHFGLPIHIIDIHSIRGELSFGYVDKKTVCYYQLRPINRPIFYASAPIRADSALMLNSKYSFPQVYRYVLGQFLEELGRLFPNQWFPGTPQRISNGDSKIFLLDQAQKSGLLVPSFCINGMLPPTRLSPTILCKKSLGHSFMISNKRSYSKEVTITRECILNPKIVEDGLLWQWQELIDTSYHVRTHITEDKCWAVCASVLSKIQKRNASTKKFDRLNWKNFQLATSVKDACKILLKKLNLSFASPEFLLTKEGQLILIDFNPCGDWYGFFNQKRGDEITKFHLSLLQDKVKE